jgi:serine/threonine protein kinase/Leucine-rich repeat (LRR) protein
MCAACGARLGANSTVPKLSESAASSADPTGPFPNRTAPETKPPFLLGTYRVKAELGRGGMGVVYRAEDTQLRREVALKVMLSGATETDKARFLREARAQAAVEHENVATIYQVVEAAGTVFLAMPLLRGRTLADELRAGPLSVTEAVRVLREIAEGLAAAHARGLVHRDIKPGNVWLEGEKRRVKILDFGLARPFANGAAEPALSDSDPITHTGGIVGTPAYMSPEQARGEPTDFRSDLFSLGTVAYLLLTGRQPFREATLTATLIAVATDHPPAVRDANPAIPPDLSALVSQLMEKAPAARPRSAREVADRLAALIVPLPVNVAPLAPVAATAPSAADPWADLDATVADDTAADTVAPPRPPASSARFLYAALAALLLAVAAAGTVIYIETRGGTLKVELADGAEAKFKNGSLVIADDTGKDRYRLTAEKLEAGVGTGKYTVRVEGADGLALSTPEFVMKRNGEVVVRVTVVAERKKKEDKDTKGPDAKAYAAERRAAEWVLGLRGRVVIAPGVPKLPPEFPPVLDWNMWNEPVLPNEYEVTDATKLPKGPFVVTKIELRDLRMQNPDPGLTALRDLKYLVWLDLFQTQVGADGAAALATCTNLAHLNLQRSLLPREDLKSLTPLKGLTCLILSDLGIDDSSFETLAGFPRLRKLVIDEVPGAGGINGSELKRLNAHKELRRLWLHGQALKDHHLDGFAPPQLESLFLSSTSLTNAAVPHLAKIGTLTHIEIQGTKIDEQGAKELAKALPGCRIQWTGGVIEPTLATDLTAAQTVIARGGSLRIDGDPIEYKTLPNPPFQINTVSMRRMPVTAAHLRALRGCRKLTELNLTESRLSDDALEPLNALPNIRHLDLNETGLTDGGMVYLKPLAALEHVTLYNTAIGDDGLAHLAGALELRYVDLGRTKVTDAGFAKLAATCTKLDGVWLSATAITDDGLTKLADLRELATLGVSKTRVTDKTLSRLQAHPKLKELDLSECSEITDDGFAHLAKCARLGILTLDRTPVTDAGLKHLAPLKGLQFLSLTGTGVTDAALDTLKGFETLTYLKVSNTKLTENAVRALAKALPKCRIEWNGGDIVPAP